MWCYHFPLHPLFVQMFHLSISCSHSLMVLYEPLEVYVWGLIRAGCFFGWCLTIDLASLHFIFCEAHATHGFPFPHGLNLLLVGGVGLAPIRDIHLFTL
jgi:hypothetical protein